MDELLTCLMPSLLGVGLLLWGLYALVRAHRFVTRAEPLLRRLEALETRLAVVERGWVEGRVPAASRQDLLASAAAPPVGGAANGAAAEAADETAERRPVGEGATASPSASPAVPVPPASVPPESGAPASASLASASPASATAASASPAPGTAIPPAPAAEPPTSQSPASAPLPRPDAPSGSAPAAVPASTPGAPAITPWWSDLEEKLGARLPVWLGALALALSGAFLVKYSVDQGWLGPPVRVGLAIAFGVTLLSGAGLLRRAARPIAGALAAAGIAVLYAAFLAAVHLYGLLAPAGGFALMAVTTAVAVGLSLVFGPIVAVIGLVGGMLTPYWVQVGEPDPKRLFAYLLLVHAGVAAVSRRRAWPGLSLASLAGGFVWVVAWLEEGFRRGDGALLQVFLLVAVVAWGISAVRARRAGRADEAPERSRDVERFGIWAATLGALAAFAAILEAETFGSLEWSLLGLLVAGVLAFSRLREEHHLLAWLAVATSALLLLRWAWTLDGAAGTVSTEPQRFLLVTGALGGLAAVLPWLAMWRVGGLATASRPDSWAALSAAAGFVFPVVAWSGWRLAHPDRDGGTGWALLAVALAAVYAAAALPVARRRGRPGMEAALAALAVAVTALAAWSAALAFRQEVLTVTWALEVAALATLAGRFRMPVLVRLAALLAVPVTARLLFDPALWSLAAEAPRVVNAVLATHALVIGAFAAAVLLLDRLEDGRVPEGAGPAGRGGLGRLARHVAAALRWAVLLLLVALVGQEVVHAVQPPDAADSPYLGAALAVAWLALGVALLAAAERWPERLGRAGRVGSRGVVSLGLLVAAVDPGLLSSPLWSFAGRAFPAGPWPVWNHLLWAFGGPALLLALAVRWLPAADGSEGSAAAGRRGAADRVLAALWGVASLGFLFLVVTFEVMQVFRGSDLGPPPAAASAEGWALSAAWLVLGVGLLGAGIAAGRRFLRAGALLVTGVAVIKVFLFDVARLGDLYRVLSFLGLGLSLLLLAWLYQRFVFRRDG